MLGLVELLLSTFSRMNLAETMATNILRYALAGLVAAVAALCAMASLGCAIAALWIYALPHVGPVGAPLIAAGALLLLCLIGLIIIWLTIRRHRKAPKHNVSVDALLASAAHLVKEHQGAVLIAALIAGLFTGKKRS